MTRIEKLLGVKSPTPNLSGLRLCYKNFLNPIFIFRAPFQANPQTTDTIIRSKLGSEIVGLS